MSIWLPEGKWASEEEWNCNCPKCGNNKFFWNAVTNKGHCKSGSCSIKIYGKQNFEDAYAGKLSYFETLHLQNSRSGYVGDLDVDSLWYKNAWDSEKSRLFLESRGITEKDARRIPIYWIENRQALGIRMFPCSEEYESEILYRPLNMDGHKWMTLKRKEVDMFVWGAEFWLKSSIPYIILCEGIMDIISSGLIGKAIAMLGSEISLDVATWIQKQKITAFIWGDADKAGMKANKEVKKLLNYCAVPAYVIKSLKDPKDYKKKEVNKLIERIEEMF